MNANDVIRIGRKRKRAASTVASKRGLPSWCNCLANSTMRIAFLQARPTQHDQADLHEDVHRQMRDQHAGDRAQETHGTTRMTASGSTQLSYSADSARKTANTAAAKTRAVGVAFDDCK